MDDIFEGGRKLPLVEDFYTIQGEGFHTGKPAYFVRLGGCDIGCYWCDAKHTWNSSLHPLTDTNEIIGRALSYPSRSVVITGGEPSLYPLDILCDKLIENGIETFIETSGAYPLSGRWSWICLSPKKNMPPDPEIFARANELKVIVHDSSDFEWAEINSLKVNSGCILYLQPEWSKYNSITHSIIEYVKSNPKWNISLQAHKFMQIP